MKLAFIFAAIPALAFLALYVWGAWIVVKKENKQ